MQSTRRRESGYVLVTVMAVLALTGLALAGFARRSLLLALEATEAQEALQRRWGVISCQRAILGRAEALLEQEADRQGGSWLLVPSPRYLSVRIRLGALDFDLRLADEDAKANVNTAYRQGGEEEVAWLAQRLDRSPRRLIVRPRPFATDKSAAGRFESLDTWGQAFDIESFEATSQVPETLLQSTDELTCWGRGKLNLLRASDEAVELICRHAVPSHKVRQLLELRQTAVDDELGMLVDRLALRQRQRTALLTLLTMQSQCHSLWIMAGNGHRRWCTLYVAETRPNTDPRLWQFNW